MPDSRIPQAPPALAARPLLPERLPLRLQDLPPRAARFCLRVADFLTAELERAGAPGVEPASPHRAAGDSAPGLNAPDGMTLLVGVSGGADSLALLLALRWLAPRLGLRLHAAVLDHGLRPESAAEARAVSALCRRVGVPCRAESADVAALAARECCGAEDAGRRARYAFFAAERLRVNADWVCTAHQSDDLCEDVLLRLVRGTGWPGLGGMPAVDPQRRILRPLLMTERQDIDAFLTELGVLPVRDPSNHDPAYRRNRLRHDVLPLLRAENPALGESVRSLWDLARCDADYWSRQLGGLHSRNGREAPIAIPARTLRGLHRAARLRLYKRLLDRLGPGQPLAACLIALDEAWMAGHGGACVQFPGGKTARIVPMGTNDASAGGIEFCAAPAG